MIVCSDLHLQVTPPRCRTENEKGWMAYQGKMLKFLVDTANAHKTDLYIAGDITDKAVTSPQITSLFIRHMNKLNGTCYIMPGNHCLPNHAMEEMDKASYGILAAIAQGEESKIKTIDQSGYAYVAYDDEDNIIGKYNDILFVHRLTFASMKDIPPGCDGISARELLDKYITPKILVVGDNHSTFVKIIGKRTVVNCGCTTKRAIDFQDKELAIYEINDDTYEVQMIPIPDDSVLVRDAHVEVQKENEEKFKALVELLKDTGTMTLDYVANLHAKQSVLSAEGQTLLGGMIG